MQKTVVSSEVHVKCDICGKEKVLKADGYKSIDTVNYGWSHLELTTQGRFFVRTRNFDLCPLCTAKFGKLIGKVETIEVKNDDEFSVEKKKEE